MCQTCAGLSLVLASGGCSQVAAHELGSCRTWALERGLQLLWPKGSVVVVNGISCPRTCGIFPYQELYPCPLHWQVDSLLLDYQGSSMAVHFVSFKNKISTSLELIQMKHVKYHVRNELPVQVQGTILDAWG